ncbi:MAG: hypothetical protein HFG29_01305 [Eubacterium sp.]|nr:hypothetical protein [Eubacterium sp.]
MNKYKVIFNMLPDVWKVLSRYKDKDVSQDKECEQILSELQKICDKYRNVGETEGKLAREISHLFLEYLCKK